MRSSSQNYITMSRHTASNYSSTDMRVPDVQQHIVHHTRSRALSNSARHANRPRSSRHIEEDDRRAQRLSQSFISRSRQDDTIDTGSLLSLASDFVQILDRPANNNGQRIRPTQFTSIQWALTSSNLRSLDQSSWQRH